MRVLVIFCHPVETSYQAALHEVAKAALIRAGHEVDDLDLYGEGFNPVMSREERLGYHDLATNQAPVAPYIARLKAAQALVLCFPVWTFGPPAMIKGFFDRVMVPGFGFTLRPDGRYDPGMGHIRKIAAITTYGQPRWKAFLIGDPPRKFVTRVLPGTVGRLIPIHYLAHYEMNTSTDQTRRRFLERVDAVMSRF